MASKEKVSYTYPINPVHLIKHITPKGPLIDKSLFISREYSYNIIILHFYLLKYCVL